MLKQSYLILVMIVIMFDPFVIILTFLFLALFHSFHLLFLLFFSTLAYYDSKFSKLIQVSFHSSLFYHYLASPTSRLLVYGKILSCSDKYDSKTLKCTYCNSTVKSAKYQKSAFLRSHFSSH